MYLYLRSSNFLPQLQCTFGCTFVRKIILSPSIQVSLRHIASINQKTNKLSNSTFFLLMSTRYKIYDDLKFSKSIYYPILFCLKDRNVTVFLRWRRRLFHSVAHRQLYCTLTPLFYYNFCRSKIFGVATDFSGYTICQIIYLNVFLIINRIFLNINVNFTRK